MIDGLSSSSTVVDLGSNQGNFALAVSDYFRCKPFCVEPDPQLYQALAANSVVSAYNFAITTRTGSVRFYLAENGECSSLIPPTISKTIGEIECRAVTMETLLAMIGKHQVDVLKVDIEGLETELLRSLDARVLDRVNQLTVEFHESIGMGTVKQVMETIDHIKTFGFGVLRGSFFDYSDVLFLHAERLNLRWHWGWMAAVEKIRNGIYRKLPLPIRNLRKHKLPK